MLGLNYVRTGATELASDAIAKAAENTLSELAKHTYNQKLRMLEDSD